MQAFFENFFDIFKKILRIYKIALYERDKIMKFKTVVITKKKLIIAVVGILFLGGIITAVSLIPPKTANVFNYQNEIYEDILAEGLPNNNEKTFSLKDFAKKILGFDIENPETIISEYSSVFDGTTSQTEQENTSEEFAEDSTEQGEEQTEETPDTVQEEVPMPDKSQICTANNLKLNNATTYNVDVNALCAEEFSINTDADGPKVLVVHTHTTECYDGDQMNGETERNTDASMNVVAVGDEICRVLEENGIKTVHDTTYHDYPSYQGSYTRALSTIETQLKSNPTIEIVLDVHRDAFIYSDGSKLAVTCEENGISTAQVMLVVGTNSMGLWHENWQENLKFAAKIQNAAEIMYPGVMRPINLRKERFNEHMTKGSLILEVGSNGNTLAQAKEGGKDVARAIAAVLNAK